MGLFSSGFEAIQVNSKTIKKIEAQRETTQLVKIRPYPNHSDNLSDSQKLLETIHATYESDLLGRNKTPVTTFEIWYDGGEISFLYHLPNEEIREQFMKQIGAYFPDSDIDIVTDPFIPINEGEWFAGGRFGTKKHYYAPIDHRGNASKISNDPYKAVTNDITATEGTKIVIQVALKPVQRGWTSTFFNDVEEYSERVKKTGIVSKVTPFGIKYENPRQPGAVDTDAKAIKKQKDKPGFFVNLRLLSVGEDKNQVLKQCREITRIYEQTHERQGIFQSLKMRECDSVELPELVEDMVRREGRNMKQPKNPFSLLRQKIRTSFGGSYRLMMMTFPEVAELAHIPNDSIENSSVDWEQLGSLASLPPTAPKAEYPDEEQEEPVEIPSEVSLPSEEDDEQSENHDIFEVALDNPLDEII